MSKSIHWKPMTGGRFVPSELPCIISEELDDGDPRWPATRYKRLDKQGFIVRTWVSDFLPNDGRLEGLPVLKSTQ